MARLLDAGVGPAATVAGDGVPLAGACHSGKLEVVDLLLAAAPDPVNSGSPEPLWATVGRADQPIVDRLLAHGADPDRTTRYGLTVRGLAASAFDGPAPAASAGPVLSCAWGRGGSRARA